MTAKKSYSIDDPLFGFDEDFEVGANKVLMLGESDISTHGGMALAYKNAADILVQKALDRDETSWEIAAPIMYLYRHSLELSLKWATQSNAKCHDLEGMIQQANERAKQQTGKALHPAVIERMQEFSEFDKKGFAFRYADAGEDAHWIGVTVKLLHLRKVMERITADLVELGRQR
ncbi:MAG: hypothetical protein JNK74_15125 [Candidatus Hydrogenedentes bacterium]|nr:hypothetical protein [Candidatus Hydrogenedentota bacterium]